MQSKATPIDKAITFIPIFSGSLSILAVSTILYNILSDQKRRFTTSFYRIVFCQSIAELIYAIAKMTSTFVMPAGLPGFAYAHGTSASCHAQGFFLHLGFIQPFYMSSLCVYFLLVIKYGKTEECISKFERWIHTISIGYPLMTAIISLSFGLYHPGPEACTIYTANIDRADGCPSDNNPKHCLRKRDAFIFVWLFWGLVLLTSLITICWSMGAVVVFVRKREHRMNSQLAFGKSIISKSKRLQKHSLYVTRQALLYILAYLLVWSSGCMFALIVQGTGRVSNGLLVLHQFFNPLQGFLSFIIYFLPRYTKVKTENSNMPFGWLIKETIITKTLDKTQRRSTRETLLDTKQSLKRSTIFVEPKPVIPVDTTNLNTSEVVEKTTNGDPDHFYEEHLEETDSEQDLHLNSDVKDDSVVLV